MEFEDEDDDHEQEEEEEDDDDEGTTIPPPAPASAAATTSLAVPHTSTGGSRYRECQKNHAVSIGGQAVDGCGEFMPAGEDGTLNALKCAACGCHRNFHRKETDSSSAAPSPELAGAAASSSAAAAAALYQPQFPHHPAYYRATPAPPPPGYLQHPHRPLALPSTTPEMEELSNPSSSGGGKKRFRTKFTAEQKERMVEFAERIGWRITKQDEAAVEQFCSELRLSRQVLKVWLHNNKHTLGRKP